MKQKVFKPTAVRKRHEAREANILFQRKLRRAKERASLRTEQRVTHNLLYQHIAPGLHDRVLARSRDLSQKLG